MLKAMLLHEPLSPHNLYFFFFGEAWAHEAKFCRSRSMSHIYRVPATGVWIYPDSKRVIVMRFPGTPGSSVRCL